MAELKIVQLVTTIEDAVRGRVEVEMTLSNNTHVKFSYADTDVAYQAALYGEPLARERAMAWRAFEAILSQYQDREYALAVSRRILVR